MGKEIITFDDIEVEKHKFYQHNSNIFTHDVNIDTTVVSNNFPLIKKVLNILLDMNMIRKKLSPCL